MQHSSSYGFKCILIFWSIHPSIYPSIYPSIHLSIYLCICWLRHATGMAGDVFTVYRTKGEHAALIAHKNDSTLRLIGKGLSLITDTLCLHVCVCVCVYMCPACPLRGCEAIQSTHTGVSLAIALLVDAAVTVGCPLRSLDIQCKSSPVELWKKLIICYCSLGPPVASPSEHHCHLTHGPRCDNGQ